MPEGLAAREVILANVCHSLCLSPEKKPRLCPSRHSNARPPSRSINHLHNEHWISLVQWIDRLLYLLAAAWPSQSPVTYPAKATIFFFAHPQRYSQYVDIILHKACCCPHRGARGGRGKDDDDAKPRSCVCCFVGGHVLPRPCGGVYAHAARRPE